MFDDHQTDQSQDNQQPEVGLGTHPSLIQQQPEPQVVLPNPTGVPPTDDHVADDATTPATNDLESIKHQALADLSPLVSKLDQTPEEKYKTLMMMIQASDNQELITEAYHNAQQIEDDKVRAEALLGIVNEINYFNQKQSA